MTESRIAIASRFGVFFVTWLALMGVSPSSSVVGLLAAAGATWLSLYLLPVRSAGIRLGLLCLQIPRFLGQSLLAGWDVARRALSPSLPIKTGFVAFPCTYRKPHARDSFALITSLLPGTVPCGEEDGALIYHCLDIDQPVQAQLAEEAHRLAAGLGENADG